MVSNKSVIFNVEWGDPVCCVANVSIRKMHVIHSCKSLFLCSFVCQVTQNRLESTILFGMPNGFTLNMSDDSKILIKYIIITAMNSWH